MALRNFMLAASLLAFVGSAGAVDLKGLANKLGSQSQSSTASESASAASSSGVLGNLGSGLSLPAIGGDTAGNAAGVLEYCVKNKYLDGDAATTVKDKLLSKVGVQNTQQAEQDSSYISGAQGLLKGSDGKSLNLDSISGKLKDKACDYVLDNASSLI